MTKLEDVLTFKKLYPESTNDLWFIKYQESDKSVKWLHKMDSLVSLQYVDSWNPVQSDYVFMAGLDSLDEYSFVVTMMHSKRDILVNNLETFLSAINWQFSNDTSEALVESNYYFVSRTERKRAIYGEIVTTINSINYKIITCLVEDDSNIYDFTMKLPLSKYDEAYYQTFYEYINGFRYFGKKIVAAVDSISEIEEIQISSKETLVDVEAE